MFWQLLILVAVLGTAYYRWSRRRLYQLAREIPSGLRAYPIVGHAYMFLGDNEALMKALQRFGEIANQQGGLSSMWLSNRLFIGMTDPKSIELVTKNCLDKDDFTFGCARSVLGNGSIVAPVNIWHPRRKIMAPFFKLKNLYHAVKIFDEQSNIMAGLMRSELGGGDFSIWPYMTSYTLDTIFETAAEIKTNFQENPDNFILCTIDELTKMLAARVLQPWLRPDFIYERLPIYKRFALLRQQTYDYIDEIIQMKRKTFAERKKVNEEGLICMFDVAMLGKQTCYSDIELREEAMVFAVAGNDTSAVASSFTAVLLSRYPDVQDRVYQELQEVLGDSDRAVTSEDLPKLKYMDAVVRESLRIYPPAPIIVREIRSDLVLPSGTTLVAGTSVMINIWSTHRNPLYWGADADQFRPERFLQGPLPHPAQFIPFSYSVRGCIGATYAMLSVKTGLANLLRRYRVLPPANMATEDLKKPMRLQFEIMMKDMDKFIVRVEERNKKI